MYIYMLKEWKTEYIGIGSKYIENIRRYSKNQKTQKSIYIYVSMDTILSFIMSRILLDRT